MESLNPGPGDIMDMMTIGTDAKPSDDSIEEDAFEHHLAASGQFSDFLWNSIDGATLTRGDLRERLVASCFVYEPCLGALQRDHSADERGVAGVSVCADATSP